MYKTQLHIENETYVVVLNALVQKRVVVEALVPM
jgi:hypothetical protein